MNNFRLIQQDKLDLKKEIALSVQQISKVYRKNDTEVITALDRVELELHKGEILGVIGRNGSGKSTLLKVLSRITPVSSGKIEYEGVLTSIIEIGTGFHPDLSGKDNVYLSAGLLGQSKKEIDSLYKDILEFSGIEEFIDMPIKQYSSGMYLRLAFAVAFYSKIDILLLDEVIAVGDASFRRKCYQKIRDLKNSGVAIILVSHSMESVAEFCDRCLWLDSGRVKLYGETLKVIEEYLEETEARDKDEVGGVNNNLAVNYLYDFSDLNLVGFSSIQLALKSSNAKAEALSSEECIDIEFRVKKSTKDSIQIAYELKNMNDFRLFIDSYALRSNYVAKEMKEGDYLIKCTIPAKLLSKGIYYLGMIISINGEFEKHLERVIKFRVESTAKRLFEKELNALIQPQLHWEITNL